MRLHPGIIASSSGLSAYFKAYAGLYQDSAATTLAVANNDPVGHWRDQSGKSRHAVQGTAGNRPLLQTALPSILFDGTNDHLIYTGSVLETTGTAIIVFKTGSTAFATRGTQVLVSSADNGTANNWLEIGITSDGRVYIESNVGGTQHTVVGSTFLQTSTNYLLAVAYDGADYYASVNGVEQNPLTITNIGTFAWFGNVSSPDNLVVGGTVTSAGIVRPYQGEILEVALYTENII